MANPEDVDALSYEQARDELIEIVARLEAGAISLEDSLALFERGEALASRCQTLLESARVRVQESRQSSAEPEDGE